MNENSMRSGPDPTQNVKDIMSARSDAADELRVVDRELRLADKELNNNKSEHLKEIVNLRAMYDERIGVLREGYQEEIAKAASIAITTLAKQTTDLAMTLQKQVTDTAAAAEARNSAQYTDGNKRLSALELSSSEGKGKSAIADPQMADFMKELKEVVTAQTSGTAQNKGIGLVWAVIIGGGGLLLGLASFVVMLFKAFNP